LSVLLPIGTPDKPLSIALFLLIVSLAFTAISLFMSFVKQKYNIGTYGKIHSNLSFIAPQALSLSMELSGTSLASMGLHSFA
jgi:hypothetical protein